MMMQEGENEENMRRRSHSKWIKVGKLKVYFYLRASQVCSSALKLGGLYGRYYSNSGGSLSS